MPTKEELQKRVQELEEENDQLQDQLNASAKLPSRGRTMVEGTINSFPFRAALEPNGKGSHWLRVNKTMRDIANHLQDKRATPLGRFKNPQQDFGTLPGPHVPAEYLGDF